MTRKRRHEERAARLKARAEQDEREARAQGIPVDPTKLAPKSTYNPPEFLTRGYYLDYAFNCRSCGVPQLWTAAQQQWWYEVAKGDIFSTASQCRACRQADREKKALELARAADLRKAELFTPNSHCRQFLAKVAVEIAPDLNAAGFSPLARITHRAGRAVATEATRFDGLFSLSWCLRYARMTAERLSNFPEIRVQEIAIAEFVGCKDRADQDQQLPPFIASVRIFLADLRARLDS